MKSGALGGTLVWNLEGEVGRGEVGKERVLIEAELEEEKRKPGEIIGRMGRMKRGKVWVRAERKGYERVRETAMEIGRASCRERVF